MTRKAAIMLIAAVLAIPLGVLAKIRPQKNTPLHHFQLPCDACHESQLPVSTLQPDPNIGQVKGDINRLCTSSGCHNFDPIMSHPVGVVAPGGMQSGMPLDNNSRITCLTCHNKPKSLNDPEHTDIRSGRLLQKPQGTEFCAGCHMKMNGPLLIQSHWQFSTRAHLGPTGPQFGEYADFERFTGDIDSESRTCLSCHDDISITIPAYSPTGRRTGQRLKGMTDHPIGMDYRQVASRRAECFSFLPTDNQRTRLFDGRVGCGSCHSLYAKTKTHLVAPFEGSILCRKCHNL